MIVIFTVTLAEAQLASQSATNKNAKMAMKDDFKKEKKRKKRAEVAREDEQARVDSKPKYKKTLRAKRKKIKEKGIPVTPAPSKTTDY